MILLKKAGDLRKWLDQQVEKGKTIGFVPTMGALHEGHISLVEASRQKTAITVASIFVNPTQFNDPKDFEKYPSSLETDIYMLEKAGCDLVFLPSVKEMYPDGLKAARLYDLGSLENLLEGKYRPGHFQGVCMVVHHLLDIVKPDQMFLGQKDYQQCMVINKLIELIGMNDKLEIVICPTLREPDGLAMSSRNRRLSVEERNRAATIYETLCFIKENIKAGDLRPLLQQSIEKMARREFKIDYVEIADAGNLEPVRDWDGKQKLVALIAAFNGPVRLIDNLPLN